MLIKESHADVSTFADGEEGSMRIFLFHPTIPGYPNAKFPGVCLFSEIYQGKTDTVIYMDHLSGEFISNEALTCSLVTGPVARFARQIAGQGYIVAAPSSYHDFTGPEALAYDVPGTDNGNAWKIEKTLESYDEDSRRTVDHLLSLPTCNGRIGSTGMCLGGHLAVRAALDPRISSVVSYFATDIHTRSLGPHATKDSSPPSYLTSLPPGSASTSPPANSNHTIDLLPRLAHAEISAIFGVKDTHVPPAGRDLIRLALRDAGVTASIHEFSHAQHAFIRDELSKGRYDPAVTAICFQVLLELFGRTLRADLGEREGEGKVEHDC